MKRQLSASLLIVLLLGGLRVGAASSPRPSGSAPSRMGSERLPPGVLDHLWVPIAWPDGDTLWFYYEARMVNGQVQMIRNDRMQRWGGRWSYRLCRYQDPTTKRVVVFPQFFPLR